MDPSFGVCLDAIGFAPGGGWEDDVGHLGGFCEKNINDDEMVQRVEGLFTVVFIWVGDHGIFAVDEHGVDSSFFLAAEVQSGDLGHGIAEVEVGLLIRFLELFVKLLRDHGLEAGIVCGDGSAVTGALNVVLSTHRVDAGAFLAEIPGEQGEVAEGLDVVDSADVLGDAESIINGSEFGQAIPERGLFDISRRNFTDFGGPLRSEFPNVFLKGFDLGGSVGNEFRVLQSFPHDDVSHGE